VLGASTDHGRVRLVPQAPLVPGTTSTVRTSATDRCGEYSTTTRKGRHPSEVPPDEETVRRFVGSCPPFHALLLALCVAQYERCIRESDKRGQPAGRNGLFMSVCLPCCDEFISDDRDQQDCLRGVASLAKLAVKVRWFKEFRGSLEVDQSSSGAGSKKAAS
jgi:hypothetical protein